MTSRAVERSDHVLEKPPRRTEVVGVIAVAAIPWHVYAVMALFSITIGVLVALELRCPSSYERQQTTRRLASDARRASPGASRHIVAS